VQKRETTDLQFGRRSYSNLEVLDPSTSTYPQNLIPAATAALIKLCQQERPNPQFGFGGFVSNGTIETIKLTTNREPLASWEPSVKPSMPMEPPSLAPNCLRWSGLNAKSRLSKVPASRPVAVISNVSPVW
jgi:hypothetical protein